MKYFLVVLALVLSTKALANDQLVQPIESCVTQLPFGVPIVKGNITNVCRRAYIVQYDNSAKIPALVAYKLTIDRARGCHPRTNRYFEDQSLDPIYRTRTADYAKSGYDIGHMANAADMNWDPDVEEESFILSNTAPQLPNLNRGVWKHLETKIRAWAYSGKNLSIYIGSMYDSRSDVIGNNIIVPNYFYKIILDNDTHESLGFIFPNEPDTNTNLNEFQVTVTEIELRTGLQFSIPGDKNIKNHIWPANIKKLILDRKVTCELSQ